MATNTLVTELIDDGARLLELLHQEGMTVRGAAWIKVADEDRLELCVVTPMVQGSVQRPAYRLVGNALGKLAKTWITISEVRLLSPDDSLATGIVELRDRRNAPIATRVSGFTWIGDVGVEEAYVYPKDLTAAP